MGVLPHDIHRAFSHLVLDETTRTKLGTALNSGASIFLYGPSGTGKTAIATSIPRVFSDDRVWIPFAVQMDGQIITVYDAHLHSKVDEPLPEDTDKRWVLCHRPTVLVGGELTFEMLELQLNPITKFYTAPVQMKANNGVLIIDDFGRQRLRPDELLNRWVVPLDRGIDFLTLAGGRKVEIPFELFVVFATNLDPSALADPAFLRRIQTKIKVGCVPPVSVSMKSFVGFAMTGEWTTRVDLVDELISLIRDKGEPLRACHPRDFVNQIRWSARYAGTRTLPRQRLSAYCRGRLFRVRQTRIGPRRVKVYGRYFLAGCGSSKQRAPRPAAALISVLRVVSASRYEPRLRYQRNAVRCLGT